MHTKNSIDLCAIYRAIGIPEERRIWYGSINHCLRGIVTGADNLLDNEYKEMLPLSFPNEATRFKSIMHILIFDRFLFKLTNQMKTAVFCEDAEKLQDFLFKAIVPIGAEEAHEEGGIKSILSPKEILSTVHTYKGGKLLCLSFVAPLLLEKDFNPQLNQAELGIYNIGIALQLIDDISDFYEDIPAENHNYLVSSICHQGTAQEKVALNAALAQKASVGPSIETLFPTSVSRVMGEAIGEAMLGFSQLEEAGFWFDQNQAYNLIKHLFELRGLPHLLSFFPERHAAVPLLNHDS